MAKYSLNYKENDDHEWVKWLKSLNNFAGISWVLPSVLPSASPSIFSKPLCASHYLAVLALVPYSDIIEIAQSHNLQKICSLESIGNSYLPIGANRRDLTKRMYSVLPSGSIKMFVNIDGEIGPQEYIILDSVEDVEKLADHVTTIYAHATNRELFSNQIGHLATFLHTGQIVYRTDQCIKPRIPNVYDLRKQVYYYPTTEEAAKEVDEETKRTTSIYEFAMGDPAIVHDDMCEWIKELQMYKMVTSSFEEGTFTIFDDTGRVTYKVHLSFGDRKMDDLNVTIVLINLAYGNLEYFKEYESFGNEEAFLKYYMPYEVDSCDELRRLVRIAGDDYVEFFVPIGGYVGPNTGFILSKGPQYEEMYHSYIADVPTNLKSREELSKWVYEVLYEDISNSNLKYEKMVFRNGDILDFRSSNIFLDTAMSADEIYGTNRWSVPSERNGSIKFHDTEVKEFFVGIQRKDYCWVIKGVNEEFATAVEAAETYDAIVIRQGRTDLKTNRSLGYL